ncbi:MAG: hypothetical protein P8I31_00230 [Bacteroidia bacterium]|nr:hypothetical protein [Bacteroidia bacterium]
MKNTVLLILLVSVLFSCNNKSSQVQNKGDKVVSTQDSNRFADLRILTYDASGINDLTVKQKELVYYLSQAALSGREITYAQNYKHNIHIKRVLEAIFTTYSGDRNAESWKNFEVYLKRFWFSNGIHHHYAEKKFIPDFSTEYFSTLIEGSSISDSLTLENETKDQMVSKLLPVIFDPLVDSKKVIKDKGVDKVALSANNYYGEAVTEAEAIAHYGMMGVSGEETPIEYGLNSRLVKQDGQLVDLVYKSGGLYGGAIDQIIFWLEKAKNVAENDAQASHIGMLIDYFKT